MTYLAIILGSFLGSILDVWMVIPIALGLLLPRRPWLAPLAAAPVALIIQGLKVVLMGSREDILFATPMLLGAYLASLVVLGAVLSLRRTKRQPQAETL